MNKSNEVSSVDDLISRYIPRMGKLIYINNIEAHDLVYLKETMTIDNLKSMTCRPVKERNQSEYIEMCQRQKRNKDLFVAGVFHKETDELVGKVSIFDYNTRNKSVEVGYYIIDKYRKLGYAYETLRIICDLLFLKLSLNKVYAQTGDFNKGSKALLERVGFKVDGILREHHELDGVFYDDYIYSFLRSEWSSKNT